MKDEVIAYYLIANEITNLQDVYTLCSGLLLSNPSKNNLQTCNLISNKIEQKTVQIKESCPHIYFYTKYIK
ncbi:hypothetical protein [Halarcobacter sp.]|uniref:hypothetical protein n=1 Tax=Halarcobacter sp. TaxID=2321133 RepID=UPI002AA61B83|nr:hypothetical protein [Halarcobacter sp.]